MVLKVINRHGNYESICFFSLLVALVNMLMDLSRSRAQTQLNLTTRYVARSVGRYVSQLVGLHHFTRLRACARACMQACVCAYVCACVRVCEHVRVSGTTSPSATI